MNDLRQEIDCEPPFSTNHCFWEWDTTFGWMPATACQGECQCDSMPTGNGNYQGEVLKIPCVETGQKNINSRDRAVARGTISWIKEVTNKNYKDRIICIQNDGRLVEYIYLETQDKRKKIASDALTTESLDLDNHTGMLVCIHDNNNGTSEVIGFGIVRQIN